MGTLAECASGAGRTLPRHPKIFFRCWGTQPVLGRGSAPEDDVDATGWGLPGRNAVAVIGYGLWQQLFGGDRKALGAAIRVDGNPLTVIGVAPPWFNYPGKAVLWKPAGFQPRQ
jgi:putative ABC transport system permease protein